MILALDEGTTSARAALYNRQGIRTAMECEPVRCSFPQPGWVEQDAEELWRAQVKAGRRVLAASREPVSALGITNQRETVVVWDRHSGAPIAPAIVWQCRRTAGWCQELAASSHSRMVTDRTGLVIDAYFSASKVRWILDNVVDAQMKAEAGDLLFGTVDSWLIWKLTNGELHITDESNASRTMLMDLASARWDAELLGIFGIPRAMLPQIVRSSGVAGFTATEHLGVALPIAGIAGDQQAALAGQACFHSGMSKNTYGTGCFALLHTGTVQPASENKLVGTRAASSDGKPQFAIEGSIFIAGAAVQWMRDQLKILPSAAASEEAAQSVPDTGGVYLVPAFVGLGAPHWDARARASLTGLTLGTSQAHIIRATLESIAYQTRELTEAMQADSGERLRELRVDGGASANNFLMQFQADILGCRIARPKDVETTAKGAAYLAGLATGIFSGTDELAESWHCDRVFEPSMSKDRRDRLFAGWQDAVNRTLSH